MYSVVVPVYRNEEFVPLLIETFTDLDAEVRKRFGIGLEAVFVVDASPDKCFALLNEALPRAPFRSQLILHARNFGSFAAMRTGLQAGRGDYFGTISGDLQEPPELLLRFLAPLHADLCDIAVGTRELRDEPAMKRNMSNLFWSLYRALVMPEIPPGGVDMFGCNRRVRDELLKLEESNSTLVGQVFWLGFRRMEVTYVRRPRMFGKSAWTFRKKITYLLDSIFAFSDLPIRVLSVAGLFGIVIATTLGILVTVLRLAGQIVVPGYAALAIMVSFFGALNLLGLGLVGSYAWRAYENSKRRPLAVISSAQSFAGAAAAAQGAERA